jgi:threonine dehydrogenase-like Zn-dependent dehydrogenase
MKSAILTDTRKIVLKKDDSIPGIKMNEVLIRVRSVGICGSDMSAYTGNHPYKAAPAILGHELSGEVVKIGSKVKGFELGDKVSCLSFCPCNVCKYCIKDEIQLCENKTILSYKDMRGGLSEFMMLKADMIFKIPQKISFETAALIEPLSIGLHAINMAMNYQPTRIAILGAGPIGLSCLILAKAFNIEYIAVSDIGEFKNRIVKELGANAFFSNDNNPFIESESKLFDCVFVCSSYPNIINDAINMTKKKGVLIILSYFSNLIQNIDITRLVRNEQTILGSALSNKEEFRQVIRLLDEGLIDPSPMISHRFNIDEVSYAFQFKESNPFTTSKIIINL